MFVFAVIIVRVEIPSVQIIDYDAILFHFIVQGEQQLLDLWLQDAINVFLGFVKDCLALSLALKRQKDTSLDDASLLR